MVLIITSKVDPHADKVIEYFYNWQVKFFRFNTEDFPINTKLSWTIANPGKENFLLQTSHGREIQRNEIKSVWYRKPLPFVFDKKITNPQVKDLINSESNATINGLYLNLNDILWINNPHQNRITSHKLFQLRIAKELGFEIPDTLITNNPKAAKEFYSKHDGNIINKPINQAYLETEDDYFLIYTNKITKKELEKFNLVSYGPTLFQEYIPKKIELRVTIVGNQIFTCAIDSQSSKKTMVDWRHYDFENVPHFTFEPPQRIKDLCLNLVKKLGLVSAAIDMVLTPDKRYIFLEINPNGQYLWLELLTGLPISNAIARLLCGKKLINSNE